MLQLPPQFPGSQGGWDGPLDDDAHTVVVDGDREQPVVSTVVEDVHVVLTVEELPDLMVIFAQSEVTCMTADAEQDPELLSEEEPDVED